MAKFYKFVTFSLYSFRSGIDHHGDRVFHKDTTLAIMPILEQEDLLHKNERNPVTKCYPSGDITQAFHNL